MGSEPEISDEALADIESGIMNGRGWIRLGFDKDLIALIARLRRVEAELAEAREALQDLALEVINTEAKAREFAEHYPQSSDGRNTFVIFADWIADQHRAGMGKRRRAREKRKRPPAGFEWLTGIG